MPSQATSRTRRALAIGSYGVLAAIVLSYIDLIPAVDHSIDGAGASGQVGVAIALGAFAVLALVCWFSATWYAISTGRRGLAILLGLTNFVGGFFFYFAYVAWRSNGDGDAA